jgi:hypothetical protein
MHTITQYDSPGLLEKLTSNTAATVLFVIAATVPAPIVLVGFTEAVELLVLAPVAPWVVLGLLLLPLGGMAGYVGLFRARRPATSTPDYWVTLICLGAGIVTAGTVIGAVLWIDRNDPVGTGLIASLSLLIVAALGRIVRLRRLRAASFAAADILGRRARERARSSAASTAR